MAHVVRVLGVGNELLLVLRGRVGCGKALCVRGDRGSQGDACHDLLQCEK